MHFWTVVVLLAGAVSGLPQQPGTKLWEFPTAHRIYSSPALGTDGALYFGSLDTKVYALNPNGSKRWEFATGSWVISSPALGAEETIYVGSLDYKLYALTSRGAQKWAFAAGNSIYSSPAIGTDGTVYFGSLDHKLYALTPGGAKKWEFETQGEVFASPVLGADGTVYVGSKDKRLYAINPNGTKKWDIETGQGIEASAAVGVDGAVYLGSLDGKVYSLNPTNGLKLWEFATGAAVYSSPAVGPDGSIYVGGYDAKLYALNPDGTKKWEASTDGRIAYSSPAIAADGTIYVGCMDSRLYAFKADGTRKWLFATANFIDYSAPAIAADGTVYVGSTDGKLYAIKGTAGLAGGPWPKFRRDARNSGGGFVERDLPAGYSPGAKMTVTLQASPQAGVTFFAVEDTPPPNWQVSAISHDGNFDSANRKVKFGPFFDGLSRTLTYTVTPPLGESGSKQFIGTSLAEGVDFLLGGIQSVDLVPLHPADNDPVDHWMTIEEVTAYSAAWKRGLAWPLPPNPIPISYLSRAILLWEQGEFYTYDTNFVAAPVWWTTPATNQLAPGQGPPVVPAATNITNGLASAELPALYVPGSPFTVTITVRPATNVLAYAVEEQPPEGWIVSAMTSQGVMDERRGKIKWGPFFDALPRTLAYQVTPPTNAIGLGAFYGLASFDGASAQIGGQREIVPTGSVSGWVSFVERDLPSAYSPGARIQVRLTATPPTNVLFYAVEDTPPVNWVVGQISDNGFFDRTNRKVKFGPFLDGLPRTLAYEVTPPLGESGLKQFIGISMAEGVEHLLGGDQTVDLVPLHPADNDPVDRWMTIEEVTAYSAAWKRGLAWPLPPNPIPISYLSRAILLWEQGEFYAYDTNFVAAPVWWTTQATNQLAPGQSPPVVPAATNITNGLASAELPVFYVPGSPFTVAITVRPATNVLAYAVEEQPPEGWIVSSVASQGVLDEWRGKIKWGPFFDALPRTLAYQVTPPTNAVGLGAFYGVASFDGASAQIGGQREMALSGSVSGPAGFVERDLPFGYAPGARMLVMLTALPPTNALFYAVEDMPPANWGVGQISDNGFFDPANRKVKFGPFLDGLPRTLAYEVTPPPGESGLKQFSGLAFADWEELPVKGERVVDFVLLHPADNNPVDSVMTLGEMTAYGAAWKRGSAWPSPPNPVALNYLTRAIVLWEEGETYTYDGTVTNAPLWWVSQKTNESLAIFGPVPLATGTNLPKSSASVELPKFYQPDLPIKVTIQVVPATNVLVYAVEDQPPIGWSVSEINEGGFLDAFQGKIKWGPFFDRDPRTLTYLATPASDAAAVGQFYGIASFDGSNLLFSGRRQIVPGGSSSVPGFGALELLPKIGFQITLPGIPGEVYVIEASTNLAKWLPVATLTNTSGSLLFTDPAATNLSRRFYRAVWP